MRNIFVLATGRCGTHTFWHACNHMNNFTSSHEETKGKLNNRLAYPDNHIAVDSLLPWQLGTLYKMYGDDAYYVWLKRDREDTAASWMRFTKWDRDVKHVGEVVRRFATGFMCVMPNVVNENKLLCSQHYVDTVNDNIELFMYGRKNKMTIQLETIKSQWECFWNWIGAEGNFKESLSEWDKKYYATKK